jgi:hypothetical protein
VFELLPTVGFLYSITFASATEIFIGSASASLSDLDESEEIIDSYHKT